MPLIECVPNVSEGRRPEVVEAMVDAVRRVPGVRLLDHSSDASHNRSVLTLVGTETGRRAAMRFAGTFRVTAQNEINTVSRR